MASWTDYAANLILDYFFTIEATLYIGLSTTTPNPDGTNFTEPVGGSYARLAITAADYAAAAARAKANDVDLVFATPTGAWGTITHYGIFDHPTAGNLLTYTNCPDRIVSSGDSPKILTGDDVHDIA